MVLAQILPFWFLFCLLGVVFCFFFVITMFGFDFAAHLIDNVRIKRKPFPNVRLKAYGTVQCSICQTFQSILIFMFNVVSWNNSAALLVVAAIPVI